MRISVVQLPMVHHDDDLGFVPQLIGLERERGVSALSANGSTVDQPRIGSMRRYRFTLEKSTAGVV